MRIPLSRLRLILWLTSGGLAGLAGMAGMAGMMIAPAALHAAGKKSAEPIAPADTAVLAASAQAAYQRGELTEAAKLFESAVKQQPDNPAHAYNAGIFFFQTSKPQKAEKHMRRVLKLNPDHALAYFYLGLLAEKSRDYSKAIDLYSEAARRDRRVLEAGYNKEIVQSKLTMDVRLRRYTEGDRPLDFAPVSAAAAPPAKSEPPPVKPVEKPREQPRANPAASPAPAARPAPSPAPPPKPEPVSPSEIRIESKPPPPSETPAAPVGTGRTRPPAPVAPPRPPPGANDEQPPRDERPPPPVYGPYRELPEIDKP